VAEKPIVIKMGGSILGTGDTTLNDLVELQKKGVQNIVVHGGGNVITSWMEREGRVPRFTRGLRVTDYESLETVTAVLTGLINKQLVASIQALGGRAIGLSGVDGGLIEAEIDDPELGYVGKIRRINAEFLYEVMTAGYIPFIAPVGLHSMDTSRYAGCLLNINGDTVAGRIASTVNAQKIIFMTDVEGVMDNSGRVIPRLNKRSASLLLASQTIKGGMIPKIEACLASLDDVGVADIIDGRNPGALRESVLNKSFGTQITL